MGDSSPASVAYGTVEGSVQQTGWGQAMTAVGNDGGMTQAGTLPGGTDGSEQGGQAGELLARLEFRQRLPAHYALLQALVDHAAGDKQIAGLALVGSLAGGRADRYSDVDLMVVVDDEDLPAAFAEHLMFL